MSIPSESEKIGSFKIIEKIGEGGMAVIYKAVQPSLKRSVVIKKLKDPNREIIERFKKEAFVSASFSQENVLSIYDFVYSGKSYYLIMEYVDGQDLRTIIDYSAPLPPNVAALLIREVAKGLEYTHNKNIIHRDIKPSNILISYEGEVKLIDFGVAKDETPSKLTLTGMIVGTPSYMSPEQANGDPLGKPSDIYALGVLLYEMMTGVKPYLGDTNTEVLMKIAKGKFPSPKKYNREIPWRLVQIIKKAMRKDISRRYANAYELIRDLNRFIPSNDQKNKQEFLVRFLKKFEADRKKSATTTYGFSRVYNASSRRMWFGVAAMIIIFFLAAFQTNRFLVRERLVQLQIKSPVRSATVFLNDMELGRLDRENKIFNNLVPGDHTLQIKGSNDRGVFRSNIRLSPGGFHAVDVRIPQRNNKVLVDATSEPTRARVFIDNKPIGNTPLAKHRLSGGKHQIRITRAGYVPHTETIELEQNQTYHLHYRLTPLPPESGTSK